MTFILLFTKKTVRKLFIIADFFLLPCFFQSFTPTPSVKRAMRRCGNTGRFPERCAENEFALWLWRVRTVQYNVKTKLIMLVFDCIVL